ncbi:MAG: hypothetical protein ACTHJ8_14695 [Mucilaginibacter sp.]|jgi:hypothetical protein
MNSKKITNPELLIISVGLLLVTVPFLLNTWIQVSDFMRGGLMGIGIGMEVIGIFRINRRKRAETSGC